MVSVTSPVFSVVLGVKQALSHNRRVNLSEFSVFLRVCFWEKPKLKSYVQIIDLEGDPRKKKKMGRWVSQREKERKLLG